MSSPPFGLSVSKATRVFTCKQVSYQRYGRYTFATYVFHPKPAARKVDFQLSSPTLPVIKPDAVAPPPPTGFGTMRRNLRTLTPPEIHAIGKEHYEAGTNLEDLEEAVLYFSIAAEMGYAPAQNMYAYCLEESISQSNSRYKQYARLDLGSTEFREKQMIMYYTLAADSGHGRALSNLGICYVQGNGVSIDLEKGMRLLRESKERGDPMGTRNYDSFMQHHGLRGTKCSVAFSSKGRR